MSILACIIQLVELPYDDSIGIFSKVTGNYIKVLPQFKITNVKLEKTSDLQEFTNNVSNKIRTPVKKVYYRVQNAFHAIYSIKVVLNNYEKKPFIFYTIQFLKGFDSTIRSQLINRKLVDFRTFVSDAKLAAKFIKCYLENVENRNIDPIVQPGFMKQFFPENIPTDKCKLNTLLLEIEANILPWIRHSNHPQLRDGSPLSTNAPSIHADFIIGALNTSIESWVGSLKMSDKVKPKYVIPEVKFNGNLNKKKVG